jgi:hypothetical protein
MVSVTYDPDLILRIEAAMREPESADPPLERRRVLLRLSLSPSLAFTSYSWVIVASDARRPGSPAIVREVRCRGGERAGLTVRDVEIDEATTTAWCREAAAIPVPLVGFEKNLGCDGTTYTLFAESGFAFVNLSWWHDGPREWRPLTGWARALMKRLHDLAGQGEPLEYE